MIVTENPQEEINSFTARFLWSNKFGKMQKNKIKYPSSDDDTNSTIRMYPSRDFPGFQSFSFLFLGRERKPLATVIS